VVGYGIGPPIASVKAGDSGAMRASLEPLAVQIYRRYLQGESVQQIADDLGIPAERVRQRVEAAALLRIGTGCAPNPAQGTRNLTLHPN